MSIESQIKSRGFVHQEAFLTEDEIRAIRSQFDGAAAQNQNYPIRELELSQVPDSVMSKIDTLKKLCFPKRDLLPIGAVFFTINRRDLAHSVNFPWHQDHESFFQHRQHYHYLNFWIVLEKDDPENSNLSVLPFDRLAQADPMLHKVATGAGATRYFERSLIQDLTGSALRFNCDLDSLSHTPKMKPGDLLLIRGDMIHRTQNQRASRMSVSFRCIDRNHVIDRSFYYPSSLEHLKFIQKNLKPYAANSYVFQHRKTDFLTVGEIFDAFSELRAQPTDVLRREFQEHARQYDLAIRRRAQIALQLEQSQRPQPAAQPALADSPAA